MPLELGLPFYIFWMDILLSLLFPALVTRFPLNGTRKIPSHTKMRTPEFPPIFQIPRKKRKNSMQIMPPCSYYIFFSFPAGNRVRAFEMLRREEGKVSREEERNTAIGEFVLHRMWSRPNFLSGFSHIFTQHGRRGTCNPRGRKKGGGGRKGGNAQIWRGGKRGRFQSKKTYSKIEDRRNFGNPKKVRGYRGLGEKKAGFLPEEKSRNTYTGEEMGRRPIFHVHYIQGRHV